MINGKALFHLVFVFWIVMDAVGTLPIFVSLLKHFDPAKQRKIIIRELLIALGVMIIFLFFGQGFLNLLHITQPSLQVSGGIILFMLAIKMIFSIPPRDEKIIEKKLPKDPLIVPLAIPAIAGPGILAMITLYAGGLQNTATVLVALIIAWFFSLLVLLAAPLLKKYLGDNGVVAVERLFGYILVLISTQMTVSGILSGIK